MKCSPFLRWKAYKQNILQKMKILITLCCPPFLKTSHQRNVRTFLQNVINISNFYIDLVLQKVLAEFYIF